VLVFLPRGKGFSYREGECSLGQLLLSILDPLTGGSQGAIAYSEERCLTFRKMLWGGGGG